jgi:hypothetical protein
MRAPVVVFSYIQQSSMMFVNMVVPEDNSPYMGTSGASSREESGMLNWFKVSHLPSILQTKEIQVHVLTYLVVPEDNSPYMGTSGASSREESGMLNWFKVSHLPSILQTKEIQVHVLTYLVIIGNPITPTFELNGKEKSLLISCLSHAEIEAL